MKYTEKECSNILTRVQSRLRYEADRFDTAIDENDIDTLKDSMREIRWLTTVAKEPIEDLIAYRKIDQEMHDEAEAEDRAHFRRYGI